SRSTSASRRACCSRSRRSARASRRTNRSRRSASRCRCRRTTSGTARRWSRSWHPFRIPAVIARERPATGEPEGALVLLHGRGADEHDLFPLLEVFDPERRLDGFTPRAPLALPPGGAHWYVVPRVGFPDADTFWSSYRALAAWLDALPH